PPGGVVSVPYAIGHPCLQCTVYGFPLYATGGTPPYSWTWAGASGSSTPPGLMVRGPYEFCTNGSGYQICGVPMTAGTYDVVVTVSDSASPQNQTSANYTIGIVDPPPSVAAVAPQIQSTAQQTRYKLIDVGTLGGPASYFTDPGIGGVSKVLNNQGMLAGKTELEAPDPNNANCPPACFVTHAFRWDKGVLSDLGTLPGGTNSDIGGINARGWVVGGSE